MCVATSGYKVYMYMIAGILCSKLPLNLMYYYTTLEMYIAFFAIVKHVKLYELVK